MSAVNVTNVSVLDNPSCFVNPFQFEISYECVSALEDGTTHPARPHATRARRRAHSNADRHAQRTPDLEWKITYVGSADDESQDQELDSVLVGPIAVGSYRFVFQADAPDPSRIPPEDLLGVTVVLLTCSYRDQEFVRVGYYVNNEYDSEELKENPPSVPQVERIERSILADKPRVTKFQIRWDDSAVPAAAADAGQEGGAMMDDDGLFGDGGAFGGGHDQNALPGAPPQPLGDANALGYGNAGTGQPFGNAGFALNKAAPSGDPYDARGGLPHTVPRLLDMEE